VLPVRHTNKRLAIRRGTQAQVRPSTNTHTRPHVYPDCQRLHVQPNCHPASQAAICVPYGHTVCRSATWSETGHALSSPHGNRAFPPANNTANSPQSQPAILLACHTSSQAETRSPGQPNGQPANHIATLQIGKKASRPYVQAATEPVSHTATLQVGH
jgi:hypothetical protein